MQLLYRTVGSDAWSYAYADFIPGPRVATNLDLRIGGSAYLPPGTELEYYYVIRDAQGNAHQTRPQIDRVLRQPVPVGQGPRLASSCCYTMDYPNQKLSRCLGKWKRR